MEGCSKFNQLFFIWVYYHLSSFLRNKNNGLFQMENALKEKTLLKKFVDVYLEMSHLQKSFPSAPVHFPFVRKQLWWNSKSIWKDIFTMKENVYIVVLLWHYRKLHIQSFLYMYIEKWSTRPNWQCLVTSSHYSVRFPGKLFKCRRTTVVGLVSWYYIFNVCT